MIEKASAIFCLADAFIFELLNRFKIHGAVFAQRADDIFRKFIPFIDISADFAYKSFLAVGFRLRFDVLLIVGVGHSILIAHDAGFSDAADKHAVGAQINILFYFQGHKSVDVFVQEYQPISGTVDLFSGKLVCRSSGLEAKLLEDGEWSVYGQAVDIHDAGLLDYMVRIVFLIDIDRHTIRIICQLGDGIYNETIVLSFRRWR